MVLYKYFKKVPSALPNPNSSLSGRMPSEAIFSANHEMSGLVHQDTGQNSKTMNMTQGPSSSPQQKPLFLHRESILIQVLCFHVVDDVETLNYEGVSAYATCPHRYFFT